MATKTKYDLHTESKKLAEYLVSKHVEIEDGEKSFNLISYLADLEHELCVQWYDSRVLKNGFILDASEAARYLWCCLQLADGEATDSDTFRGMPILG